MFLMVMKNYPPEFKADAVALVLSRPDRTITSIARDLGISRETLRVWVRAAQARGEGGQRGAGAAPHGVVQRRPDGPVRGRPQPRLHHRQPVPQPNAPPCTRRTAASTSLPTDRAASTLANPPCRARSRRPDAPQPGPRYASSHAPPRPTGRSSHPQV
ncbi:transposase [Nonomuraea jabiensis]|uniref:transposase n=1 Tax=Nonomuraea jabiensis TaxID=882448 RepID=UPI003D740CF2